MCVAEIHVLDGSTLVYEPAEQFGEFRLDQYAYYNTSETAYALHVCSTCARGHLQIPNLPVSGGRMHRLGRFYSTYNVYAIVQYSSGCPAARPGESATESGEKRGDQEKQV